MHAGCIDVWAGARAQTSMQDLVFGRVNEMDYFRRLKERLQVVHDYIHQASVGVRLNRAYDTRCPGRPFVPGDMVWVYWQEGGVPQALQPLSGASGSPGMDIGGGVLDPHAWAGAHVLHRDRLSPYRPLTKPVVGGGDASGITCSDHDCTRSVVVLDGFCDYTWRHIQSFSYFPE